MYPAHNHSVEGGRNSSVLISHGNQRLDNTSNTFRISRNGVQFLARTNGYNASPQLPIPIIERPDGWQEQAPYSAFPQHNGTPPRHDDVLSHPHHAPPRLNNFIPPMPSRDVIPPHYNHASLHYQCPEVAGMSRSASEQCYLHAPLTELGMAERMSLEMGAFWEDEHVPPMGYGNQPHFAGPHIDALGLRSYEGGPPLAHASSAYFSENGATQYQYRNMPDNAPARNWTHDTVLPPDEVDGSYQTRYSSCLGSSSCTLCFPNSAPTASTTSMAPYTAPVYPSAGGVSYIPHGHQRASVPVSVLRCEGELNEHRAPLLDSGA